MSDATGRAAVQLLGSVAEAEVVASFLRGELASERWRGGLLELLDAHGRDPSLAFEPDLEDAGDNDYRAALLDAHRGWLQREGLFGGFPSGVDWFRAALSRERVLEVLYINWDWWLRVSDGTRLPTEAARRIRDGQIPGSTAEWHEPIAARLGCDDPPPELVVVTSPELEKLVLLEGHVRLTAYALFPEHLPDRLVVFLGVSAQMNRWCHW